MCSLVMVIPSSTSGVGCGTLEGRWLESQGLPHSVPRGAGPPVRWDHSEPQPDLKAVVITVSAGFALSKMICVEIWNTS